MEVGKSNVDLFDLTVLQGYSLHLHPSGYCYKKLGARQGGFLTACPMGQIDPFPSRHMVHDLSSRNELYIRRFNARDSRAPALSPSARQFVYHRRRPSRVLLCNVAALRGRKIYEFCFMSGKLRRNDGNGNKGRREKARVTTMGFACEPLKFPAERVLGRRRVL